MNPLKSITGTVVTGAILAVIVMILFADGKTAAIEFALWFHVLAGVAWVGLLYYFNFIQVPGVAKALSEVDSGGPGPAAINKYVAPTALLWFRWAALATWLSGVAALIELQIFIEAFTFQNAHAGTIGIGAWLGSIMLFNVWVLIWPNQRKILGLDGKTHDAAVIAKAKTIVLMASRGNTALSIPVLMSMTAFDHGGFPF